MNESIKLAMINLNRELEKENELHPDTIGLVKIPQILQEQCGFPRTVGELTVEQCIWVAVMSNPDAFERLDRAKQEWEFRRLKPKSQTKH